VEYSTEESAMKTLQDPNGGHKFLAWVPKELVELSGGDISIKPSWFTKAFKDGIKVRIEANKEFYSEGNSIMSVFGTVNETTDGKYRILDADTFELFEFFAAKQTDSIKFLPCYIRKDHRPDSDYKPFTVFDEADE
jgi:hypothetical protein